MTSIYSDLYGSDMGGRPGRKDHYRFSLLSLLKMTQADFVCYTSERELGSLMEFFYDQYQISSDKLKFVVFDLDKNEYYDILNDSRLLFNCALQDWVSNTISEGDTLGCNVLYPAYRSFPETLANDHERMYIPWSIEDAINKMEILLKKPHVNMGKISNYTDKTIDRICDILEGKGEKYLRMSSDYRKYVRESKY